SSRWCSLRPLRVRRQNGEKPGNHLVKEQSGRAYPRAVGRFARGDRDLSPALTTESGEGGPFLLDKRSVLWNPLGKERFGALDHLGRAEGCPGLMHHGGNLDSAERG